MGIVNALTIDVEEYFTIEALDGVVPRDRWPSQPLRADFETRHLLDVLDEHGARATFFVLGWAAERHASLVKEIAARGHEVGAHSYWHKLIYRMSPAEFRADLVRARDVLQDLIGGPVIGFRAPTYSITKDSLWAHAILAEEGFLYSSSIFPIVHDRYGIPDFPRFPVELEVSGARIWEFPMTTFRFAGKNLPVAGGGYLRVLPARAVAAALAYVNEREKQPVIIYLHPWEIDPQVPKYRQGWFKDARGYVGIDGMLAKVDYLLSAFDFSTVRRVLSL